jgi:hypothetical protein
MSKGEGGTSKAHWIVATPKSSRIEMGRDRNGLYSRTAKTQKGYDTIWVIMDRLTKVAHSIPIKKMYTGP